MLHSRLRFQLVFIASFLLFTANGFTSVAQDTRLLKDGSNTTFLPYSEEAIMPEGARVAIERHDEILRQQGYKVNTTRLKVSGIPTSPSSACGTCNDMGAENGWSYWKAFPGTFGPLINPVLTFNAIGVNPTPLRFNITSGSAIDRYTPGAPGTPSLPVVAPGFGQHSIQLGQPETDGIAGNCTAGNNGGNPGPGCAERLTFCFTVGPADTNFIYAYAFIIEDPGHGPGEEPFISFIILDATGDTVSCAYQRYEADQNDPRQYLAGRTRTNSQGTVTQATYKPWTIAGVNLTNYVGQTLTVVITNADCARSGHFAHSYWDFKCGNADAIVVPNCIYNSPDTLTGPPSTDPVSDPYSYTWFKNNTPNPVGYTQTIYPLSQNGDTFTVRVSNLAGCSWYARFVPQHDSVKADFIAQSNCGYANFVNQSFSPFVNDTIFSWTWTFNGGTPATATGQFPPDIYFPPGDHLVTLISSSRTPGCMDTIEHVVNVPHLPVADFTVPVQCAGTELTITNLSTCESDDTLATYSWNLPGAAPSLSSDTAPVITFDSGGVQTITLVATTTDGCRDTVSKTVQVLQRPTAGIAATPVCQGFPLQVGNTTTLGGPYQPMQYAWSFPGGVPTFATDSAPVVSFTSSGSSDITLIATTPDGCSDTVQSQVAIHPTPQAEFVAPQVCESVEVSMDNLSSIDPASSIVGFHWYFTGGSIDTTSVFEPTLSFFPSGTDSILLVAIGADGCVDTVSGVIDVLPSPVTSFTLSDACFGEAVTVSDSSTIAAGGGTLSYSWSSSAGQFTSTSVPEPQLLFPAAGSYPVTLITTSTLGCSDTAQQTAIVHQLPLASFAAPPVCLGQATVFENLTSLDSLEQYSFLWSFPTGQPVVSSAFEPVVTFSDTGQSAVQLIVETGYGCLDTLDQFVTVYRPPLAVISSGDSACVPICHSFSDLSIQGDGFINQWTWSFPGGEPSSFTGVTPPQVCYAAPGSYEVELKVKSSIGCTSSVMVPDAIRAYSIPDAGFFVANPTSNVFSPSFQFQDTSSTDVVLWAWDFGDGTRLASSETSPVHSYAGSVLENDYYRFLVSLVVTTRYGCMDTVYGTVDVKPEFTFYVPSAFTPNGDGSNQFFFGKGIGIKRYTIRVFDRWGLQLWNCEEEGSNLTWDAIGSEGMPSSCQWDGTYAGMRVESDVYVWQVSLTDVFGVDHSYTGRVTVAY